MRINDDDKSGRRAILKSAVTASLIGTTAVAGCTQSQNQSNGNTNTDGSGNGQQQYPLTWTLGTSSQGSGSFRIGTGFAEYLKREGLTEHVELSATATPGTSASFQMLDQGEVDVAASNTVLMENAPDKGPFEQNPLKNFDQVRQIRGYQILPQFFVVKPEIEGWSDLEGEPVMPGTPGGGTTPVNDELIDVEVGLDNVDNRYMGYGQVADAWRSGRIKLFLPWATNYTTAPGFLQEVDATSEWKPLQFSSAQKEYIENQGFAQMVQLTSSDFTDSVDTEIDAYAVLYLWSTHADNDTQAVYDLAKHSYENAEALIEQDSIFGIFDQPKDFLGSMHPEIPVHKGAYKFYTESGLWEEHGPNLSPPPNS